MNVRGTPPIFFLAAKCALHDSIHNVHNDEVIKRALQESGDDTSDDDSTESSFTLASVVGFEQAASRRAWGRAGSRWDTGRYSRGGWTRHIHRREIGGSWWWWALTRVRLDWSHNLNGNGDLEAISNESSRVVSQSYRRWACAWDGCNRLNWDGHLFQELASCR